MRGKVHQGRLFYLRELAGKAARIKERSAAVVQASDDSGSDSAANG